MIRIRTLGGLSASRDDQPHPGAAIQPRRLAVLALIARAGERGITRERLLALLWPDTDPESARRALSQALHTLRADLVDDLFMGVQELRLNFAAARCDVCEFETAVSAGEWERAAAAYGGPFLHGFRLAGAVELDRWMEEERSHLAHRYAEVLERLARLATDAGDHDRAVSWWRKRLAVDPLSGRVTAGMMGALAQAGERHAAVQQARIYQALMDQEQLDPDPSVARLVDELRAAPTASALTPTPEPRPERQPAPDAQPAVSTPRAERHLARTLWATFGAAAAIVAVSILGLRNRGAPPPASLLAVGSITDYRRAESDAPVTDMLATNLARIQGLQVVSTARLLELIVREGRPADAAAYAVAARRAGASDLMEGGLHATRTGLTLELRRVDLASGKVRGAWRLQGTDLFELVDSATAAVAASLALRPSFGSGQSGTTSLVAWRFYEEGLHAFARGDYLSAEGLFDAALREDSTFAMAAFHQARSVHQRTNPSYPPAGLARLERLAAGAGDRERLQILAWVAHATQSPRLDALADTLIARYPADIEAQYLAAFARMARADFAAALPYLHQVIAADTGAAPASEAGAAARCLACDALQQLLYAYHALDSIPAMERTARRWLARDSSSAPAWTWLATALDIAGHPDSAIAARRRAVPFNAADNDFAIAVRIRAGDFAAADPAARARMAEGSEDQAGWQGFLMLTISLHNQARWDELLALNARWLAELPARERAGTRGSRIRMSDALTLLESGRHADAHRILDSMTRSYDPAQPAGIRDRDLTMLYALQAEAALGTGDTIDVARAADSASAAAARADKTRERGFATHAQALARIARQDTAGAIQLFQRAIYSPTLGYTRTNYHLAQIYLARGDAHRTAALLRPALQGEIGLIGFTDLHELIAQAHDRLGMADSARFHWTWVARALRQADPSDQPRYRIAMSHLAAR